MSWHVDLAFRVQVFRLFDERSDDFEYEVHVSMLEIYNETIQDLLVPTKRGQFTDFRPKKIEIRATGECATACLLPFESFPCLSLLIVPLQRTVFVPPPC